MRLALRLAPLVLSIAALPALAQPARTDSTIIRPDRTIFHEHAPTEVEWGYAQAIVRGDVIYLSGTIAGGATVEQQARGIYRRIERTLKRFGADMKDVVKETVFAKDVEAFAAANGVRKAAYGGHAPAATWVQISRLLAEQALVEIEVTAIIPRPATTP